MSFYLLFKELLSVSKYQLNILGNSAKTYDMAPPPKHFMKDWPC